MRPYEPLFRNAHLQTIAAVYWPRLFRADTYPVTATYYRTEPGVQVLVHSQQPSGRSRGALILVHGLEGSSDAGYLRSAAQASLEAGFSVHRTNIRSCGGTEGLCNTLYHAGLTTDLLFLVKHLRQETGLPVFLAGFSLGANMSLKLAGELGEGARDLLGGVIAVSTPLDLAACAKALNHPRCWLYENSFVRHMGARLRRRHALMPDLFPLDALKGVRTVYDFDDRITAPFFGFGNAKGYYGTQSSGLFLDAVRVPTLVVHAKDDPMIPFEVYQHPAFRTNPAVKLITVDHGGHVGFLSKGEHRFWLDYLIRDWISGAAQATVPPQRSESYPAEAVDGPSCPP